MSEPVAVVTGAASGIGLAVTEHLLSRGYRVVMADVNAIEGDRLATEFGSRTMFQRADVSNYSEQAALFSRALDWGGRLDFFAANAGIDDQQSLYQDPDTIRTDSNGLPKELNLKTVRVNLDGVFQGLWLFRCYLQKSPVRTKAKIVITASSAGIYAFESNPQYAATKHALVGLTRSCAPVFLSQSITINCICPAFVPTNLCPPHLQDLFPKQHITPMSTVLKAIDVFLGDQNMTGQVVELSLDQLYFRTQPEWANDSQRWLLEDSKALWQEVHKVTPAKL